QPFTRIAPLKADGVIIDGTEVSITLGQGATPVPPPFAAMVRELHAKRSANLETAASPTSPWLFPGRVADSHVRSSTLRSNAMKMGINLMAARSAALAQLVLDCPPAVVADMLGYSYQAIDRHAVRAGSTWSSYAALRAQRV
ncbi:MAG: recombinase XerD, partial [Acidimicrobiales bacterium]